MATTATTTTTEIRKPKAWNVILWIAQILLAVMFIMAGFMKSTRPLDEVYAAINWAPDVPVSLLRFIGITELLGGIGLLLPAIFRLKPVLTTLAAIGIMLIMVFAAIFHITRGEYPPIVFNLIAGGVAAFIAWGRTKKAPILPR